MKINLYEHKIGNFTIRCQIEDYETVNDLFQQFIPSVLYNIFKLKNFDLKTEKLPLMNGVGFRYKKTFLTVFAEDYQLMVLDSDGLAVMAKTLEKKTDKEDKAE